VLVDTEKDGHRVSFNQAFKRRGLDHEWGVGLYGELLEIGGGKERMTKYFTVSRSLGCVGAGVGWAFDTWDLLLRADCCVCGRPRGGDTTAQPFHTNPHDSRPNPPPHLPPQPDPRQDVSDRDPFLSTTDPAARAELVKGLHLLKTDLFMGLVETGAMPLRPGVARLVREAIDAGGWMWVGVLGGVEDVGGRVWWVWSRSAWIMDHP